MKLTNTQIKQAKPKDKSYYLSDGKGLRLLVHRNGSKYWRLNYRYRDSQKTLAIGVYPDVALKAARLAETEAKALLVKGVDPSADKQRQKRQSTTDVEHSFIVIAKEWWHHEKDTWSANHANRVLVRLMDNTKDIHDTPLIELNPQDIIAIVRQIESRNAMDVAARVLTDIKRVCRYAVQSQYLQHNPATELSGILKGRKAQHRPSLPKEELGGFLVALEGYQEQGRLLTQLAIELLVLTFVRSGELREARWNEFDFDEAVWRVPASRMKMGTDHLVPLSKQAIAVLEQIKPITGQYELLFPSERSRLKPMSDNTMRRAIFKMGYDGTEEGKSKAVPHGFRATASSILNETGFNPDAIERQLSHMERNGVRAAYTHHARYLDERRKIMAWWADFLDIQRAQEVSGNVIQGGFVKKVSLATKKNWPRG